MTSELRELVPVPMASVASATSTSRPDWASARAIARPTTPAPMTTQSTSTLMALSFRTGNPPGSGRSRRHGRPAAVRCCGRSVRLRPP
ncbi:hypothetical protein G6F63_016369 [Rhizopus arrhizus]|nr:hypothetical protein G6F63_016369 [Rhizopus arrhizus]